MASSARARVVFHVITFAIGAVALAWLIAQTGWDGLVGMLSGAGWWFAALAAIDLVAALLDTAALHSFLRDHASVGYWRVFAAELSGMAINRLTPGHTLGEPVKVTMLMAHVPASAAVAGVLLFNLATIGLAIVVITLGVPLTMLTLELSASTRAVVLVGTAVLVVLGVVLAALVRRGALGGLIDVGRRVRLISAARAERWRVRVADIDDRVAQLGRPGARLGIALVLASRVCLGFGTVVVMFAVGVPLDPPLVAAMLTVGILITWITNVVPLGLGLADGSNYALFGVLGSTGGLGLAFTMINRVRTVVVAAIGLTVMAIANAIDRVGRRAPKPPL